MKVLIDKEGKKTYYDAETQKQDVQTHHGVVKRADIIRARPGDKIKSHKGTLFTVFEADFVDKLKKLKRGPQIITLKDAGIISAYTGIGPGSRVVEAGSGSGFLTCYLANLVQPTGKVYSYEVRKDFAKLAQNNIARLGLDKYVTFKNKDVKDTKERDVDAFILDVPEPWHFLATAADSLRPGGRLVCYLPTTNQVIELLKKLEKSGFSEVIVKEIIERRWQSVSGALRPASSEIGHTAFLIFARKY